VDERDALARPRAHSLAEVPWTAADIPLLDEARFLLGPVRAGRRRPASAGAEDEVRKYGHILVDEAQDLSAMALRMLARRSIAGSMTLVGDVAQATSPVATAGWDEVLAQLPGRRPPRMATLTVNYRTPAEIMETAAGLLASAGIPGVTVPRSVRATGQLPIVLPALVRSFADDVASAALAEADEVRGGTVAVIAPTESLPALAAALDAAGAPWGEPNTTGLSATITLLDLPAVKGLEFDSVIVAEPAAIVAEGSHGMQALFVALTRPTRRLVIMHALPLPDALVTGLERGRSALAEGPAATPSPVS
jgi:DNA helicase IV